MKVYAFLYNSMTAESSWATMSLHKTRRGAEMAMEFHKHEELRKWRELYPDKLLEEPYRFGRFEDWAVEEMDVLE